MKTLIQDKTNRTVLIFTAFALIGTMVFPPWAGRNRPGGYYFIFTAGNMAFEAHIDVARLVIECLCVCALSGIVWVTLKGIQEKTSTPEQDKLLKKRLKLAFFVALLIPVIIGFSKSQFRKDFLAYWKGPNRVASMHDSIDPKSSVAIPARTNMFGDEIIESVHR